MVFYYGRCETFKLGGAWRQLRKERMVRKGKKFIYSHSSITSSFMINTTGMGDLLNSGRFDAVMF